MTPFEKGFVKAAESEGMTSKQANALLDLIKGNEGFRPQAYTLNGERYPTVGYGHNLTPDTSNTFAKLFGTNVGYQDVSSGRQALNQVQADQLLNHDVNTKSNLANAKIPNLPSYPEGVRNHIIDGFYRGDLAGSPKTIGLINKGNWADASKEFLNNNEYKNAARDGKPGVVTRMNETANIFQGYADELSGTAKAPNATPPPAIPSGATPSMTPAQQVEAGPVPRSTITTPGLASND